jgi:hypothetical protein
MSKQKVFYFDLKTARKTVVNLHSGRKVAFYAGQPGRNEITDLRDLAQLRVNSDLIEVVKVRKGFIPVDEAPVEVVTTDAVRQAEQTSKVAGDENPKPVKPATKSKPAPTKNVPPKPKASAKPKK